MKWVWNGVLSGSCKHIQAYVSSCYHLLDANFLKQWFIWDLMVCCSVAVIDISPLWRWNQILNLWYLAAYFLPPSVFSLWLMLQFCISHSDIDTVKLRWRDCFLDIQMSSLFHSLQLSSFADKGHLQACLFMHKIDIIPLATQGNYEKKKVNKLK